MHGTIYREEPRRRRAVRQVRSATNRARSESQSQCLCFVRGVRDVPKVSEEKLAELVRKKLGLTPSKMIKELNLFRPIFRKTAAYGHMGRERAGVHMGANRQSGRHWRKEAGA